MTSEAQNEPPRGASTDGAVEGLRWHRVLASADLARFAVRKVLVAGREVLLARLEDRGVAALASVCPHEHADLSRGKLYTGAIDCPRHHYLYELRTGLNRHPREVFPADLAVGLAPLPLFPAKEQDGWIWVALTRT